MLRLWKQLLKMNIKRMAEYRADFFIGIIAIFLTNLLSVTFFWIIFQNIPTINGWTFEQMLFLIGISYFSISIWHVFLVGASAHRVERHIRDGKFDMFLLRPVNTLLFLLMGNIDDDGIGDMIAGIMILWYSSSALSIAWTIPNILFLILTITGGVLIFFSFNLIISTTSFWVTRSSAISELLWPLTKFTDYPLEIYNPVINFFLTFVIPFGFINYYPSQYFLQKTTVSFISFLTPLVGLMMFFIAYSFWKYGIKNYSSTGT
ncbi:MAG: ABC-2 family transporter protein [Candidatus Aenigmatarchaeota archaeon]